MRRPVLISCSDGDLEGGEAKWDAGRRSVRLVPALDSVPSRGAPQGAVVRQAKTGIESPQIGAMSATANARTKQLDSSIVTGKSLTAKVLREKLEFPQ